MGRQYVVSAAAWISVPGERWPAVVTYKDVFFVQPWWPQDIEGALRHYFAEQSSGRPEIGREVQPDEVAIMRLHYTDLPT